MKTQVDMIAELIVNRLSKGIDNPGQAIDSIKKYINDFIRFERERCLNIVREVKVKAEYGIENYGKDNESYWEGQKNASIKILEGIEKK